MATEANIYEQRRERILRDRALYNGGRGQAYIHEQSRGIFWPSSESMNRFDY
ncbi:unnamed protein product [Arabidopsis halleri]